jgi:Ca2+-binding EF-hand superfamily protein
MRFKSSVVFGLSLFVLVGLLGKSAAADDPAKPDPPGTGPYMTQLRAWFKAADLDSDGYLDKEELAKVFRGSKAKPFDFKEGQDKEKKEGAQDKESSPSQSKPDYSKYIDYLFLTHLDKDKDEKISKEEFESWARDYAVQLKHQDDQTKKTLKAEQRLANATTRNEIQAAERELAAERDAMNKLANAQKAYEKSLQHAMKGGKK